MNSDDQPGFCLTCGEEISGRRGKKYCDKKCYNDFYNEERRIARSGLVSTVKVFERSYHALVKLFPRSNAKKYIPLTQLIQEGFDLNAPCNKCKISHFEHEITRIANYGYHIDARGLSVIIFKFQLE